MNFDTILLVKIVLFGLMCAVVGIMTGFHMGIKDCMEHCRACRRQRTEEIDHNRYKS